jgi:hypothetical protein
MLEVCEFTGAAGSGVTEPHVCRLSDEEFYYVKGRNIRCQGLVNEYVCGHLGKILRLPIPDFEIAILPPFPTNAGSYGLPVHLGFGPVFASKRVAALAELDSTTARRVPPQLRRDIAAFDFWIGNGDRTLTETGGNPNLFWELTKEEVVVLDHNLAFDPLFSREELLQLHVFRVDLLEVLTDVRLRSEYGSRFAEALSDWEALISGIPEDWLFLDRDHTMDASIDFGWMRSWLDRLCDGDGWRS